MNVRPQENMIGVILKGYPRLSETFIMNEILLLEKSGLKLHIFAMRNPGESKVHENVQKIKAPVTYIPDHFWRSFFAIVGANFNLWLKKPRLYRQEFRFALMRSIRQRSSSTLKRFSQAAYLVQRCLPEAGVSHFYAHFSHGPTTVALFASRLTGIRYSFSAHAKDIYLQEPAFFRQKLQGAEFVVTCTEYNKQYLTRFVDRGEKIFRVYHGIDTDIFTPEISEASKNTVTRILSIGRFVPKKGFPVLIEALAKVKEKRLAFRCDLIGGGPLNRDLKRLVLKSGLDNYVKIHSKMLQKEIISYYRRANLFVLACEVQKDGDRDGIPNVLVEAMAMGIPVVSTSISGIPELIQSGESGILVPEKNPDALAEVIVELIRNPELARQLGRAGRVRVEKEFDSKQNVKQITRLLNGSSEGKVEAEAFDSGRVEFSSGVNDEWTDHNFPLKQGV